MAISNYPNGFPGGVIINGVPLQQTNPGKVFYLGNNATLLPGEAGAVDGAKGDYLHPVSTLQGASALCSADRGDVVFIRPGFTQTIADATTFVPVAGVAYIGLGRGNKRPLLTFSATGSAIPVSVANVIFSNIQITVSIDAVVKVFNVTAAGLLLDRVDYVQVAAKSPVTFLLTSAAGTDLEISNCRHVQNAAVSVTKWIDLVGADRFYIHDSHMRVSASTHILGGTTTASLDGRIDNVVCDNVAATVASIVMLANTTGTMRYVHAAGGKTAIAGNVGAASMQCLDCKSSHTANKNALLDPVVDA